jgi:hypothetical protein
MAFELLTGCRLFSAETYGKPSDILPGTKAYACWEFRRIVDLHGEWVRTHCRFLLRFPMSCFMPQKNCENVGAQD